MHTTNLRPLIAMVLAVVFVTLIGPAAGQPAPVVQPSTISFFGMNTYFTGLERNRRDGEAGVARLIAEGRALGAGWAREEMSWGNLERQARGVWSWEPFDSRLRATAEAGYGIIGMLLTTPAWARVPDCAARISRYAASGVRADDFWCPPANPQDFANYVRTVVERYDGDGVSDAPGSPRVAVWQIWNEPNAWETWPGTPAEYAAILEAGYAAAKSADPSAVVATAGVYVFDGSWRDTIGHSDGLRFLDEAFAARPSAWGSFDALAIHPYMPTAGPDQPGIYGSVTLWGRLVTSNTWMAERTRVRGGVVRPIWISELGWSTCTSAEADCYASVAGASLSDAADPLDWRLTLGPSASRSYTAEATLNEAATQALVGVGEDAQASYLVRAHGIAFALGIKHMNWFQLEDKFDGSARNFWEEAAILRPATENYARKQAAVAYATLTAQLGNATYTGPGPLHGYKHVHNGPAPTARFNLRFRSDDQRIVDLIWRNSGTETISMPLEAGYSVEVISRDGARVPFQIVNGGARFNIGGAPVYMVQGKSPRLSVTAPSELTALMATNDPALPFRVRIANEGIGPLTWQAQTDVAWATVNPPSGQTRNGTVEVRLQAGGLQPGVYRGTLKLTTSLGNRDLPLRLVVLEQPYRVYVPLVGAP